MKFKVGDKVLSKTHPEFGVMIITHVYPPEAYWRYKIGTVMVHEHEIELYTDPNSWLKEIL